MGAGDVGAGPAPAEVEAFRVAGRYLVRRGLVRGTEGNLSTLQGSRFVITRSGANLNSLGQRDVLVGSLEHPPFGSSSDLEIHRRFYEDSLLEDTPTAVTSVVHAHPAGTVPAGWREGRPHGAYAMGRSLEGALATLEVHLWHRSRREGPGAANGVFPFAPVRIEFREQRWTRGEPRERRGATVSILDQTRLPGEVAWMRCETVEEVAEAIHRMAVRGAPVLGITAAFGVVLASHRAMERRDDVMEAAQKAGMLMASTRPTAVNIRWAVERVLRAASAAKDGGHCVEALLAEARAIEREDAEACSALGWFGSELIPGGANVLTHCNTGMLCTAGIGTAFGVLWCAHVAGKAIHVWVDETRPALQGGRLTTWELQRLGVPFTLIADSAAATLMAQGRVDAIVVGADRIAVNGDVANKVGTYPLAVVAREHDVPFYVAAPTSTVDLQTASGPGIPIEERDPQEVTMPRGVAFAPPGAPAFNPAFDITPSGLITAIITERGVAEAPYERSLRTLLEAPATRA